MYSGGIEKLLDFRTFIADVFLLGRRVRCAEDGLTMFRMFLIFALKRGTNDVVFWIIVTIRLCANYEEEVCKKKCFLYTKIISKIGSNILQIFLYRLNFKDIGNRKLLP